MKVSRRLRDINGGGADGWELFERSRAMIAAGVDVIELTQGEHDIGTDPVILQALHDAGKAGHTGYAPIAGVPALRDAVAARIADSTGVQTTRDHVMIHPGGQAALFAAHHAALDEGDTGLFIDPFYATYPGTIRAVGGVPRPVRARPEDGFLPQATALDVAAAEARSLLINSPNNPTGVLYSAETLAEIAAVCDAHDLWLISDEVYDTQVWEGQHHSPRQVAGAAERTLVIGSMSKSHAMTGSRCGWICAAPEMIAHLADLATNTTYGVPGYIQHAAVFGLNDPALEDKVAAPFKRRRKISLQVLESQNAIGFVRPMGAMYLLLDIRPTGLSGEDFANRLLDETHIAVMPGESFGAGAAGHIRVAMTVVDDIYAAALERIVAFAAALASET